ncbi:MULTISPECIES: MBL fold metallo-hydrolase [Chitinophagaceae]
MRIRFYKVECGDAASVFFKGTDGKEHYIFIDAGYERTYKYVLSSEIKHIDNPAGQIDLWVVSHIHDDHIGGVISYVKAIKREEIKDIVSQWWYNPPYNIINITSDQKPTIRFSEAKSAAQGEKLTSYLSSNGKLPVLDIIQNGKTHDFSGIKITVLSPTENALQKLRKKYSEISNLWANEISEAKSAKPNDYQQKADGFDLDVFTEDPSVENESSISLLMEKDNKKILWLADAIPSTIINSLKHLGYSNEDPIIVDLVKVAHHGSCGNNSNDLYNLIQCNRYVFCANGDNKYQLPSKECIVRILKNKNRPDGSFYELIFPNDTKDLRGMFDIDGSTIFEKLNFKMTFSDDRLKWIDIDLL